MDEVMAFADRVMVLRRGKVVAEKTTRDTDPKDLARLMVGREVLFDIDKGPFEPGAVDARQGKLAYAGSGTILLDEIGDMPPQLQVKRNNFV